MPLLSRARSWIGLSLVLLTPIAEARWANPTDLPSVKEFERIDTEVDAQGRTKEIVEYQIRINNDDGRDRESIQNVYFNGRSTKVKILEAKTINGEKATPVAKGNIESKAVGDLSKYFDTQMKTTLTYPNVRAGSKIYLKYQIELSEVAIPGFWSGGASFYDSYQEAYEMRVRSPKPLFTWKNDPGNAIEIKSGKVGTKYEVVVKSKGPIVTLSAQEDRPYLRWDRSILVGVSTLEKYTDYAKSLLPVHEKLATVKKLPPSMEKIREAAAKETTTIAKLNRVHALIAQEFRYFGDWRRRNGGMIPRTLKEIEDTQYGDCKDLSLMSVAIFRALGFKSDLAWVWRGDLPAQPSRAMYQIPIDFYFNHAIARIEDQGKVYWVDPTNPVAFARGTFSDIAGRPAFVLDKSGGFLDDIPPITSVSGKTSRKIVYERQPDRSMKVTSELRLEGKDAIWMVIDGFYKPVETLNYDLVKNLTFGAKVVDYTVGDFERGSRIVNDLVVPLRYELADVGMRTTAGWGFPLSKEDFIPNLLVDTKERVTDVYIEKPGVREMSEEIVGVKRVGSTNLDCEIESEWVRLSRRVTDTASGVSISDRVEVREPIIPFEKVKAPEFALFQKRVRECFERAAVIYEPR